MVTGSSGRGIHGVFPTQTLANVGDSLGGDVHVYHSGNDRHGRIGRVSSRPFRHAGTRRAWTPTSRLPRARRIRFMAFSLPALWDFPATCWIWTSAPATEDISFRQLDTPVNIGAQTPTGRLMGTTTGFTQLSPTGVDGGYTFAANTTYTGSMTLYRLSATEMRVTGTLGAYSHTNVDTFDSANIGMLAFWANSNVFGSASTLNTANNGIDFSNITIEFIPVPEPATLTMFAIGSSISGHSDETEERLTAKLLRAVRRSNG